MLKYTLSYNNPQDHFLDIEFLVTDINADHIIVNLASWRPGRYELGNFAKNIQRWEVFDADNQPIESKKVTKDSWRIETKNTHTLVIRYNYYAAELNAGSTYLNENQLYVNPVNCMVYIADRMNETCEIQLIVPGNYQLACSLAKQKKHLLIASGFDELADSPFIASATMKKTEYAAGGCTFNLWFQGDCAPDFSKICKHFEAFTNRQIELFGDIECREYHFLFQMLPYPFHHGVEHSNNTVIALGPGNDLMSNTLYTDFLGVSSHELFHLWNVKRIRPAEMLPYNFQKENYSRQGYIYEGITTYYGDLELWRSGVYNWEEYCNEFNTQLKKHFDNYGRYNLSLADSSFDTWLDGYVPGIPNRKVSIYTEGMLAAFILDIQIIKQTEAECCLDDVMFALYHDVYKKGKGYTQGIYQELIERISGHRYNWYFEELINGKGKIEVYLPKALEIIGCQLKISPSDKWQERLFGVRTVLLNGSNKIEQIAPNSPAEKGGLAKGDLILGINELIIPANNEMAELSVDLFIHNPIRFFIERGSKKTEITLQTVDKNFFDQNLLEKAGKQSNLQMRYFDKWKRGRG